MLHVVLRFKFVYIVTISSRKRDNNISESEGFSLIGIFSFFRNLITNLEMLQWYQISFKKNNNKKTYQTVVFCIIIYYRIKNIMMSVCKMPWDVRTLIKLHWINKEGEETLTPWENIWLEYDMLYLNTISV